jgi:hypothetical protein
MGKLVYDLKHPEIDEQIFHHNADWKKFYGDIEEELPTNMPKPWGHSVTIWQLFLLLLMLTMLAML